MLPLIWQVSKSVFAGMVPVCGEILWLELFSMLNLSFCIIALAETCVVLFLAHHEDPHLLPPWIVELLWACVPSACKSDRHNEAPLLSSKLSSNALQDLAKSDLHDLANAHTSLASQIARNMGIVEDTPTTTKSSSPPAGEGRGDVANNDDTNDDACERLSLFERYFSRLDTAAMGGISLATSYAWLTFTCMHASSDAICDALMQSNTDGDGVLVLSEFIHVRAAHTRTRTLYPVPCTICSSSMCELRTLAHVPPGGAACCALYPVPCALCPGAGAAWCTLYHVPCTMYPVPGRRSMLCHAPSPSYALTNVRLTYSELSSTARRARIERSRWRMPHMLHIG